MVAVEERRRDRAAQIVTAAAELLEEEGPEALTMRRLADRLGIRAPSLYKHFAGKEEIEDAVAGAALADLREGFGSARRAVDPGRALVAEALAFARSRPRTFALLAARHDVSLAGASPRERALLLVVEGTAELVGTGELREADAAAIVEAATGGGAAYPTPAPPPAPPAAPPAARAVVRSVRGPD